MVGAPLGAGETADGDGRPRPGGRGLAAARPAGDGRRWGDGRRGRAAEAWRLAARAGSDRASEGVGD
jgi:hypothetical protein